MRRNNYPPEWPFDRKRGYIRRFHVGSAMLALFLIFGIWFYLGPWFSAVSAVVLLVATVQQYRTDISKLMASEAAQNNK